MDTTRTRVALFAMGFALAAHAPERAVAQQQVPTPQQRLSSGASIELTVPLFKSRVLSLDSPTGRVAVGNPDVADIVVILPTELYVLGKDIGSTNVLLWDTDNRLI